MGRAHGAPALGGRSHPPLTAAAVLPVTFERGGAPWRRADGVFANDEGSTDRTKETMAQSSNTLHEQGLSPKTVDRHRAIASLIEELEAADWYAQRVEATSDDELRAILRHNGDEEKEHAAMVLEWLRRNDPEIDGYLRTYLFNEGAIAAKEAGENAEESQRGGRQFETSDGSLGIGSLKVKA